ncbi:MAG: hypothetical protein ACOCV3_04785, partial [Halanaerobiales bacterium]
MGFLTGLAGAVGGKLLGGLFGGNKKSSNSMQAQQIPKSDLQKQLEQYASGGLGQETPSYDGQMNTQMSDYFNQATGLMGNNQYGGNTQLSMPGFLNQDNVQQGSQFMGNTQINPSQTQNNMSGVVNDMLAGNNLGMSPEEMQA